jgi:hypothetical protein
MINSWAEPTVRNCVFAQNSADEGGAMWNRGKDPMIAGCKFVGNSTTSFGIGGAAMFNQLADPTIVDCVFTGNASANFGGAIYNLAASPLVVNSLFYENTANTLGAAIFANESSSSIINCTFTANTTALNGGGLLCTGSNVSVSNCIFWNNSPDEIYSSSTAVTTVDSSNIMGGWAGPGSNNMDEQPLFVDPTDSDYRLASGSPCIDEGNSSAVPMEITTDLDGNDRLVGQVDLGPYESQVGGGSTCPHDLDGDGSVGITDFLDLLDAWGTDPGGPPDFDGNGSVDMVDFLDLLGNWGPCT